MTAALLDRALPRPTSPATTRRPAGRGDQGRPKLRVLDQAARRRRARHRTALLVLFVAVIAGFFAVAFVHAELVAGQHELDAVRAEITQAEARHAELSRSVEEASAPSTIVERATALGMVRAQNPVYLTVAAPLRTIEVGVPITATPDASVIGDQTTPAGEIDPAVAELVGPAGAADGALSGSLGQAGGISANTPVAVDATVAIGGGDVGGITVAPISPTVSAVPAADTVAADDAGGTGSIAGVTSGSAGGSTAPAEPSTRTTGGLAPGAGGAPSGPVSSIAGTRAVTTPAGGTSTPDDTTDTSSAASSPSGSPLASAAAATASG